MCYRHGAESSCYMVIHGFFDTYHERHLTLLLYAIQNGIVGVVVPIDKLSILISIGFSYFAFKEMLIKKVQSAFYCWFAEHRQWSFRHSRIPVCNRLTQRQNALYVYSVLKRFHMLKGLNRSEVKWQKDDSQHRRYKQRVRVLSKHRRITCKCTLPAVQAAFFHLFGIKPFSMRPDIAKPLLFISSLSRSSLFCYRFYHSSLSLAVFSVTGLNWPLTAFLFITTTPKQENAIASRIHPSGINGLP